MDPIHPILPQRPNIPPVTEAPRIGRISRDERRDPRREGGNPRERGEESRSDAPADDGEDELTRHIDISA